MAVQIQFRRDTAANWTSENPTLAAGEIGYDTTNNSVKIGDGSTAWSSLDYFGISSTYVDTKAPLLASFVTDATTSRTITSSDAHKTILFTSASDITMTVDASTDFPVGARMDFIQDGAGIITVTASTATIAAADTSTTSGSFTIGTQYSAATLLCVGTDSYRLIGNIAAV